MECSQANLYKNVNQAIEQVVSIGLVWEQKKEVMGEAIEIPSDDLHCLEDLDSDQKFDKLQTSNRRSSR